MSWITAVVIFLSLIAPPAFGRTFWQRCQDAFESLLEARAASSRLNDWRRDATDEARVTQWFDGLSVGQALGKGTSQVTRVAWPITETPIEASAKRKDSPLAVKDIQSNGRSESKSFERMRTIISTTQQLSDSGEGPKIVGWAVRKDKNATTKNSTTLRVVMENLYHRPNLIAAGSLDSVEPALSRLPKERQKEALIKVLRTLARHPDPNRSNIFVMLTRDPSAEGGVRIDSFFVDIDGPLVERHTKATYFDPVEPKGEDLVENFWSLQRSLLRYFSNLERSGAGFAVSPEEVFPDLNGQGLWAPR